MVAGFADAAGRVVSLVRFSHPTQTRLLVELVLAFQASGREVNAAMEPTGVYGDSLRYQLVSHGIDVFRVDPKRAHDVALVLDGVASQHDPKACTLIAFLHAQGISSRWRERSSLESNARTLVDEHAMLALPLERLYGRIEAATATHWPELNALIDQRTHWYLHLLAEFPAPLIAAQHADAVRSLLRRKTYGALSTERIDVVVRSAHDSLGVPTTEHQRALVQLTAREILAARARVDDVESRMRALVRTNAGCASLARALGPAATVAMLADVGDPAAFASAAALEKACGLNLRERSSGKHQGRLHISKRGSTRVRQYLFLAALRMIANDAIVRRWYERRGAYRAGLKHKAIVAVMRKLARAAHHVARGDAFDANKLFDVRRLSTRSESTSHTSRGVTT